LTGVDEKSMIVKQPFMDHADALRIVIFEYLLPHQRRVRMKVLKQAFEVGTGRPELDTESSRRGCFRETAPTFRATVEFSGVRNGVHVSMVDETRESAN